jgi:hypothetical protein
VPLGTEIYEIKKQTLSKENASQDRDLMAKIKIADLD